MKVQRDQNEAFIEKLEKKQAGTIWSFQKIYAQKDGMKFFDLKKKKKMYLQNHGCFSN